MDVSKASTVQFQSNLPRAVVRLLDGNSVELILHYHLSVEDALGIIAEKCDISDLDARYFSLGVIDKLNNFHWLDNSLILYDLVAYSTNPNSNLMLTHNVRYFVETIYDVQCPSTAMMYFLEVHNQMSRHELLANSDDYIELISIVTAVFAPDCHEDTIIETLSRVIPNSHPPYILMKNGRDEIERRVIGKVQQYRRLPVGTLMIRFLKVAEKSESYGYKMYEVTNENNEKCILSIGGRGIYVYKKNKNYNLITPHARYPWRSIENLYYRDTTFTVEIRVSEEKKMASSFVNPTLVDDKKLSDAFNHPTTQVSTCRRAPVVAQESANIFYNYICSTSLVGRTVWSSAIAQHQFHLEQKAFKNKGHQQSRTATSNGFDYQELTEKLNRLTSTSSLGSSLPSLSSLHSSSSLGTMPSAKIGDGSLSSLPPLSAEPSKMPSPKMNASNTSSTSSFHKKTPEEFKRDLQRYNTLRSKKAELEAILLEKLRMLKEVCIEEGEITGTLPEEINNAVLPGEEFPRLKRRVGTAYSIPDELIKADKADKMGQMETDVELHRRIVAAASRLATDKNTNKSVRKKRQKDLQAARVRLNRLEQGLQQMRHSASKPDISSIASDGSNNSWTASSNNMPITIAMTKSCPTTPRGSVPDLSRRNDMDEEKSEKEENAVSRRAQSTLSRHSLQQRYSGVSSSSTSSGSDSLNLGLPPRPNSRKSQQQQTCQQDFDNLDNPMCDIPSNPMYENVGYRSTSYRSSYRQAHYPTIQDEHVQRKRAQSAHSISTDNGANGRTSTYSVPLNDAGQKFIDVDYGCDDEDDVTPTNDQPHTMLPASVRRITSSMSCQAGFATASLDRRYSKPATNRLVGASDDMIRQNITTKITTFPVANHANTMMLSGKPYSASDLPRFQAPPPVARVTHLPRGSLPPYPHVASPKLPINTNPQMEALLSYYKQQQHHHHQQQQKQQPRAPQQPKTATIV